MRWEILIFLLALRETLGSWWSRSTYKGPEYCQILRRVDLIRNTSLSDPYEEQNVAVTLLFEDHLQMVAASLLKATLLAAGYNRKFIEVYHYQFYENHDKFDSRAIKVETPGLHLQMRLTPRAAQHLHCKGLYLETSPECGFMMSDLGSFVNVYMTNELKQTCSDHFIRDILAVTRYLKYKFTYLERSELLDLIHNSNISFYYFDAHNLSNSADAKTELHSMSQNDTNCDATLVKPVVLKYAGDLRQVTSIKFSPTLNDSKSIIEIQKKISYMEFYTAACSWAMQGNQQFEDWRNTVVVKSDQKRVVVAICKEARDFKQYLNIMNMLLDYKNSSVSTLFYRNRTLIQVFSVNCSETNPMFSTLFNWAKNGIINNVLGLVSTDDIATKAVPWAEKFGLGLFTYDINIGTSKAYAIGGSVKHLEFALRRMLFNCRWQRLAIISEPTRLAEALSAAIRASTTKLTVREVMVQSASSFPGILQKLLSTKARVILINAGAKTAARMLRVAQQLHMTRDKGFVWIVREYDEGDDATSVTMPYSVSFSWRGESEKANAVVNDGNSTEMSMTDEIAMLMTLENKWRERAWPPHATPILDNLLIILERIRRQYNSNGNQSLWSDIQREHIQGIKQNITIDEIGVAAPLVYVQQWGSEPQPRLLATWRSSEWRQPDEACPTANPPPDGSTVCLTPYGDAFQPTCRDMIWIFSAIVSTIFGTSLIVAAIRWTRLTLSIRDHRVETQFAKRMLARKERVFAALADHLVDRSALELLHELGTGRFGRVNQGLLREPSRQLVVAAKTLREEASGAEESEFLKEASTLATLDHENIIGFVGVCVIDGPPLLLMDHAFFGDLLQYLKARRHLVGGSNADANPTWFGADEKAHVSAKALTQLAQQAATALAYLSDRGIVHRDVRASNCLVDDRRRLKLADFGLARATGTTDGEYQMMRRGVLPVLWMSPESLATGVCSAASDVWSLGVLVFELVTLGRRPYGTRAPPLVVQRVIEGARPPLPWDASLDTRALTYACWRRRPEDRPDAATLARWLNSKWCALRPALVEELVDIDTLIKDDDITDSELRLPIFLRNEALANQPNNTKTH